MNFKDTEIGKIPNEWEVCELKDKVEITMGQSPKSEFYNDKGEGIPFMQGRTTFGEKYHYIDTWCTQPKKYAEKNDVLMSVRAPVGDVNIATTDLCIGRGLASLRMRNKNNEYLYYLLKNFTSVFTSRESGTVFGSINKAGIESVKLPFPNECEQKAIAKILSDLDEKIEINNEINKKLEEMAQAIFKQWFVDFEFPNEDGKPYKSSGGEMVESELGMIPKGWSIEDLSNLMYFQEGPGIRNWQYVEENGIKFINIKCIKNNDLDISTANMISNEEAEGKYSHFMIDERDIVMSCSGTLGKYAIVRKEHLPLCLNTSVIRFKPLKDSKYYSYIYSYLTSRVFYEKLITMACGSVQANFGPTHLKKIRMISPSINIIKKYNNLVLSLINKISLTRSENDKLTNTRNTLLPKLMSGEIRVPID